MATFYGGEELTEVREYSAFNQTYSNTILDTIPSGHYGVLRLDILISLTTTMVLTIDGGDKKQSFRIESTTLGGIAGGYPDLNTELFWDNGNGNKRDLDASQKVEPFFLQSGDQIKANNSGGSGSIKYTLFIYKKP